MSTLPLTASISAAICAGMSVCATQAFAEVTTIHCTFGTCKVEVTPNNVFEVSCEGRSIYSGPYVINTEYRTIRIQGPTADSPKILTQSLSASGIPNKATLFIGGRDIEGACKVEAVTAEAPTRSDPSAQDDWIIDY